MLFYFFTLFIRSGRIIRLQIGMNFFSQPIQCVLPAGGLQFTFPNNNNMPAEIFQQLVIIFVTFDIAFNFLFPEILIVPGPNKIMTSFMLVLKTTIDKYYCFVFWKNYIRLSRKFGNIFSVAESPGKKIFAHNLLRLCIFVPDPGHIVTSLLRSKYICHFICSSNPVNLIPDNFPLWLFSGLAKYVHIVFHLETSLFPWQWQLSKRRYPGV